jgi:hypothetical protein
MKDEIVDRPPLNPEELTREIEEVFSFNPPLTVDQNHACQQIQNACKTLAHGILNLVPEGKEQTIAINQLLAAALWARHGICRRSIIVAAGEPFDAAAPEGTTIQMDGGPTIADEEAAMAREGFRKKFFPADAAT